MKIDNKNNSNIKSTRTVSDFLDDIIEDLFEKIPNLDVGKFIICLNEVIDTSSLKEIAPLYTSAPDSLKKAQIKLLKRGWYITSDFELAGIFKIDNMSDEEIEKMMKNYALVLKQSILSKIKEIFSYRYNIIKDAFKAHDNGLYNISIPVMLAQADGIAKDLFDVSLYTKNRKLNIPKTKHAKEKKITWNLEEDSFTYGCLLLPLDIISSIQFDTWDRDEKINENKYFGTLNRHGVLHGLDLNYGKEENGLRCILLLGYLLDVKEYLDKKDFA